MMKRSPTFTVEIRRPRRNIPVPGPANRLTPPLNTVDKEFAADLGFDDLPSRDIRADQPSRNTPVSKFSEAERLFSGLKRMGETPRPDPFAPPPAPATSSTPPRDLTAETLFSKPATPASSAPADPAPAERRVLRSVLEQPDYAAAAVQARHDEAAARQKAKGRPGRPRVNDGRLFDRLERGVAPAPIRRAASTPRPATQAPRQTELPLVAKVEAPVARVPEYARTASPVSRPRRQARVVMLPIPDEVGEQADTASIELPPVRERKTWKKPRAKVRMLPLPIEAATSPENERVSVDRDDELDEFQVIARDADGYEWTLADFLDDGFEEGTLAAGQVVEHRAETVEQSPAAIAAQSPRPSTALLYNPWNVQQLVRTIQKLHIPKDKAARALKPGERWKRSLPTVAW